MSKNRKFQCVFASILVLLSLANSAQAKKTRKLPAPAVQLQNSADSNLRRISVKMPKTYGEILGDSHRYRQGIGYGCEAGEAVKTCDANTDAVMPPSKFLGGSELVLGSASNPALLGIKVKTKCTARVEYDNSSLYGCVYEGCFGYDKPITMVCVTKGSQ